MSDIQQTIRDLNAAWQRGDLDTVRTLYHPQAILLPPDAGEPLDGRDLIVESYREFLDYAELVAFEITAMNSRDFGATGVCHMRFVTEYRYQRQHMKDSGLDVYVLQRADDDGYRVVWRSQTLLTSDRVSG